MHMYNSVVALHSKQLLLIIMINQLCITEIIGFYNCDKHDLKFLAKLSYIY